jgi:TolA-binding protein
LKSTVRNHFPAFIYLSCIAAALFFTSCSTRKNTWINRTYHTVTSKYNINFNGKEALKAGEKDLATKVKDNYTGILPVYNYPSKNDLNAILPAMNRAIEKASKAIYKHSMLIKGKEYVKTMDDAYLLMGKAYFYKQEYREAQRIFNYMANNYADIKKWECTKEAKIWNARTALQLQYYMEAQSLLEESKITAYSLKKRKFNVLYNAAAAEYQLTAPDGEITTAIDCINEALHNRPQRDFKTRLLFILGQLYELTEQMPDAQRCFTAVIKRSPAYDMEFSAQMHLATNYDGSASQRELIMKYLHKMLSEKKNEPYRDQIYYAMSEIERIDGDTVMRMEDLALSVTAYDNNNYQRTFSSITLADLFFDRNEYVQAQNYYDTAMLSIPKNYPNYEAIVKKSSILKDLVDNLKAIELEDSLQRIAKMPPAQRDAWVQSMINQYTENERKMQEEEAARMIALQNTIGMANVTVSDNSGKWYFYNTSLLASGRTEFYARWGNRKLEDNWRISRKQELTMEAMEAINSNTTLSTSDTLFDEDGNVLSVRENDPKKPAYYTQDLPLTPAAIDSSNAIVINALYNAALIYSDLLNDFARSNETLEKLIQRFPEHELAASAHYLLFLSYSNLHDNNKALEHKNIILTKYADTDFARLLNDPDYYKRLAEQEKALEAKYEITYLAYSNLDWAQTVLLADETLPVCKERELAAKYAYLRGVAIGELYSKDSMRTEMMKILADYDNTAVIPLVEIQLSLLQPASTTANAASGGQEGAVNGEEVVFKHYPGELHYVVVLVDVMKAATSKVKEDIAAFNSKYHSIQNFNINSFYVDKDRQMITIAQFVNQETAMNYYRSMVTDSDFNKLIQNSTLVIYAMSATNYTTYYTKRDNRNQYDDFFKEYYLDSFN